MTPAAIGHPAHGAAGARGRSLLAGVLRAMRPTLRLLDDGLVETILAEARGLLEALGVEVHCPEVLSLLGEHGARVDRGRRRAFLGPDLVDRALATAPRAVALHDVLGARTHDLSGTSVHFTPGSAAIHFLDGETGKARRPPSCGAARPRSSTSATRRPPWGRSRP